jgi:DNA-binding NarL/FixJ family response regulator
VPGGPSRTSAPPCPGNAGSPSPRGHTTTEVARALHLSNGTVRNHLPGAIGKTNAGNGADAARIADDNGWL